MLGFSPTIAVVMGLVTGVFGGVIRDILCNQVPLIFKKELYAVISLFTAGLYITLNAYQLAEWINLVICLTLGFSLRMLALRYHWSMPTFDYQASGDQHTH